MEEFEELLAVKLTEINVDVEVYTEYITGIVDDESMTESECRESLVETLRSVLLDVGEGEVMVDVTAQRVADEVLTMWEKAQMKRKLEEDEKRREAVVVQLHPMGNVLEGMSPRKQTGANVQDNREDAALKKRLVAQFGCQVDETVEFGEDGELLRPPKNSGEKKSSTEDEMLAGRIDNREMVKSKAQKDREKSKIDHEIEVKRRTEQKQKDQHKKEKEKQRVAKQERRSGR
eukprot:GHVS01019739.1.p1 GENE.GHVS01019739.1~~GHVS01019739.1.p1  ORF type:complete len:232 (-),score=67.55 GHVS01019739.1:63-758(-)